MPENRGRATGRVAALSHLAPSRPVLPHPTLLPSSALGVPRAHSPWLSFILNTNMFLGAASSQLGAVAERQQWNHRAWRSLGLHGTCS